MNAVMKIASVTASLAMAAAVVPARAEIDAPVPVANFIVFGGLDWVWAGPCAPIAGDSCNASGTDTLTAYQASQGWRFPTEPEFVARPAPADFGPSNNFACGSAWFGSGYIHCDYGDAENGYIWDYGYNLLPGGTNSASETWFVRGASVPEPAAWALMLVGLGFAGATMRRRRAAIA